MAVAVLFICLVEVLWFQTKLRQVVVVDHSPVVAGVTNKLNLMAFTCMCMSVNVELFSQHASKGYNCSVLISSVVDLEIFLKTRFLKLARCVTSYFFFLALGKLLSHGDIHNVNSVYYCMVLLAIAVSRMFFPYAEFWIYGTGIVDESSSLIVPSTIIGFISFLHLLAHLDNFNGFGQV